MKTEPTHKQNSSKDANFNKNKVDLIYAKL